MRRKLLTPDQVKAINKFNSEMNDTIGTDPETTDDNYVDDEIYVDMGELIPRDIIREAERELVNERKNRLY